MRHKNIPTHTLSQLVCKVRRTVYVDSTLPWKCTIFPLSLPKLARLCEACAPRESACNGDRATVCIILLFQRHFFDKRLAWSSKNIRIKRKKNVGCFAYFGGIPSKCPMTRQTWHIASRFSGSFDKFSIFGRISINPRKPNCVRAMSRW